MNTPQKKRLFTAEIKQLKLQGRLTDDGTSSPTPSQNSVNPASEAAAQKRHNELMDAIKLLTREVRGEGETAAEQELKTKSEIEEFKKSVIEEYRKEIAQATELRSELQELSEAIEHTKEEIAALGRAQQEEGDKIVAVANELDAVVNATEHATEDIMSAVERIDEIAVNVRANASSEDEIAAMDEINELVIKVFEACNFQDITGQRITKVVNTMKFVEDRVDKMIAIWGGAEQFAHFKFEEERHEDEDRHLLNGPQLDQHKISQDEIDALFD